MNIFNERQDGLQTLIDRGDDKRIQTQAPVFHVQSELDLPYIGANDRVHLMELYRPESYTGTLPIILDVHGVGWYRGDKANNRYYGMFLASKGYAVLNINYTAAKFNDLRHQIQDILCAMRWIQRSAEEFDLDRTRLALSGDSAGAHLALLAYIVNRTATLQSVYAVETVDLDVQAFGLVCPVTDLHFITDAPLLPLQKKITEGLFGSDYRGSTLRYCSSIPDVLRTSTHLPPVYLVSSEEDIFKSQSMRLHHVLTRRNVENTFRFLSAGQGHALQHSFPVLYPEYEESIGVNTEMLRFFQRVL